MFTIPKEVADRLSEGSTRYKRILKKAYRNANQSDTMSILTDMLSEVLGFDKHSEVISKQSNRGTDCTLAVAADGTIKYLIKVIVIGLPLRESYLRQSAEYAAAESISFIVLTNGIDWHVYKVQQKRKATQELVYSFNFLDLSSRRKEDQGKLFALSREGVSKDIIHLFHKKHRYVNRYVIAEILTSEAVVPVVWRVLTKMSPGLKVGAREIEEIIREEIINRDILGSEKIKLTQSKVQKGLKAT